MEKKPNILFAFADDWGRYASCYKKFHGSNSLSAHLQTPNIDRIANEGVIFTNALVPAPTCTPCRSSVLSGRYFWQTKLGAILNGAVWDDSIPSFPKILRVDGYKAGFTYKVWSPGHVMDAPYGTPDEHYKVAGTNFGSFSFVATENLAKCNDPELAKAPLYKEVKDNFISFLDDVKDDQPFCYWWGPTNTHRMWQKGSGKNLWGIDPDTLKGALPKFFPDVAEVREDVADYLGECMAFDRGLGVLLEILEERGELDNTFIVVSGDHGIPGFPRAKCNLYDIGTEVALMARLPNVIPANSVNEDIVNIMDLAPTFLDIANIEKPKGMVANSLLPRMLGNIDFNAKDYVILGRERHVSTARENALPYPQRAIRTKEFLYIINFAPERWPMGDPCGLDDFTKPAPEYSEIEKNTFSCYPDLDASPTKAWMVHNRGIEEHKFNFNLGFGKRPKEELYDLKNDPHLLANLANEPTFSSIKAELHSSLIDNLKRQADPRVCDEDCKFEHSPYTDTTFAPEASAERLSRA